MEQQIQFPELTSIIFNQRRQRINIQTDFLVVHDKCFEKKIKPGREIRIVRGVGILLDG